MQLLRCAGGVQTASGCGAAADSKQRLLRSSICSLLVGISSSAKVASSPPYTVGAPMGSRHGSRLVALLQVASRTLTDGRSGLGGLAVVGSNGFAAAEVLHFAAGSRSVHPAAHGCAHARAAVLSASTAQHSSFSADYQQTRGMACTSAAQETASLQRRRQEARQEPLAPSSAARSAPAPRRVQGAPRARASPPSRRATWRPETQQDRAAAALADRMDMLVRTGHPQAAMDLFEINFQVKQQLLVGARLCCCDCRCKAATPVATWHRQRPIRGPDVVQTSDTMAKYCMRVRGLAGVAHGARQAV